MTEEIQNGKTPDFLDMGEAIRLMKDGYCVQRLGWNGKNMYLYIEEMVPSQDSSYWETDSDSPPRFDPVIVMRTATGTHQPGWLASQADLLANDWQVVHHNV